MADEFGKVSFEKHRGWHVVFRAVRWPGSDVSRRIRVTRVPAYGKIETKREAEKVLNQIRAELTNNKALFQVLSQYLDAGAIENSFKLKWRLYCDSKIAKVNAGRLDPKRLSELRAYEDRGYWDYFEEQKIGVHQIDSETLVQWINFMRGRVQTRGKNKGQPIGEKTIKDRLGDIMGCLRWLLRRKDLFTDLPDPSPALRELEVEDPELRVPSRATAEKVWAEIPFLKLGLFILRAEMGFRPTEARRLDVRDLVLGSESDLSDAYVYLPGSKSKMKKERKLQLPEELRSWLLHPDVIAEFGSIDRRFGNEPLFINPDATKTEAKRWCEASERNTIRRACTKAGVPHIAPNQLGRHFFASDVIAGGGDIYALKSWLGHADIKSTERYLDVAPQVLGSLLRLKSGPQAAHKQNRDS